MRKGADDNLEAFAKRIETRIRNGMNGSDSMERLICRLLTKKKNPQVSAILAQRWVEWRYGKPKETVKVEGHIEHTVFDAARLTNEQLAEAERLIESAHVGTDQG
jgi:hypothetical protein